MKLDTKHSGGLVLLRVNNFHSPFSPFFCSSNLSFILVTVIEETIAWSIGRGLELVVKQWTSANVNA